MNGQHNFEQGSAADALSHIARFRYKRSACSDQSRSQKRPQAKRTYSETVAQIVYEQVKKVAKERTRAHLTLETYIVELGLDSIERHGNRRRAGRHRSAGGFPKRLLARWKLAAKWSPRSSNTWATTPRQERDRPGRDSGRRIIASICYPEYLALKQNIANIASRRVVNPYFKEHERITNDTTQIGGRELINFSSYNYLGMSGDPIVHAGRQGGDRPLRHQRLGQPAGLGRKADASRTGTGDRRLRRRRRRHRLCRRALDQRNDDRPPVRAGRFDSARRAGAQQHHPGLHAFRGAAAAVSAQRLAGARPIADRTCAANIAACWSRSKASTAWTATIPDLPQFIEVKKRTKRS